MDMPQSAEAYRTMPAHIKENAKFAVYLRFVEGLPHRPNFAKLGADAYFSSEGKLLAIDRGGDWFHPPPSYDGSWPPAWRYGGTPLAEIEGGRFVTPVGTAKRCQAVFSWGTWVLRCTDYEEGWLHAKLAFRGTASTVVTAALGPDVRCSCGLGR